MTYRPNLPETMPTGSGLLDLMFEENVRVDVAHHIATTLPDDGHHLWEALDIEMDDIAVRALLEIEDLSDAPDDPDELFEMLVNRGRLGWFLVGSAPVPSVLALREDGTPREMFSWGHTFILHAYGDTYEDALRELIEDARRAHDTALERAVERAKANAKDDQ